MTQRIFLKKLIKAALILSALGACGVRGRPQPPAEPAYIFNKQAQPKQDKHDKSSPTMPEQTP